MKSNKNLQTISEFVNGDLKGDPNYLIRTVNSLESAVKDEIAFCVKSHIDISTLNAGALILRRGNPLQYANIIYVDEPYIAFAQLLEDFFPRQRFNTGIHPQSVLAEGVQTGAGVSIGAMTYIGEDCLIGDNTEIHSNVSIYNNVEIGKNCLIHANVVIRESVRIGDNVIIQPGAVIGADGFGFTRLSDGTPVKIPQKGIVVIGDNCEIGANTCIDRSTVELTTLEDYVKLDNLVQVGHNVTLGNGTAISAQTGISGSVKVGSNVIMGGQVGIADHATITDGVMIAAKTGVSGQVKKRGIIAGIPHQDMKSWKRNYAISKNLEQYVDRIKLLEKKIKDLEEK